MQASQLIKKSLFYYWRTNLAVVLGVATGVSVLAGALLVGNSVRASLEDLFLRRLGKTDLVISGAHYFPEELAERIQNHPKFHERFKDICPIIVTPAVAIHQESGRRASGVQVYGVDERFWQFHEQPDVQTTRFGQRDAWVTQSLAEEVGIHPGDSLLLRLEAPSEIPAESLHGRKEGAGRTLRLNARQLLPPGRLGEFSLLPQQGAVLAVFVPLKRIQKELAQEGQVNTLLVARSTRSGGNAADSTSTLPNILKAAVTLEDLGIRLRLLERQQSISMEQSSTLLSDDLIARASHLASDLKMEPFPLFTYLANRIRVGERQIPYSLVTAVDEEQFRRSIISQARPKSSEVRTAPPANATQTLPSIWLNAWAAGDLNAKPGDRIALDYYVWQEEGRLATRTAEFQLASVLPIEGFAADRDVAPEYPGISDSDTLSDWDPPFPMDLGLIRPKDEQYWKEYRTTPKAFVPIETGQKLWKSRFGSLTSLRFIPRQDSTTAEAQAPSTNSEQEKASGGNLSSILDQFRASLLAELNPLQRGFSLIPVRAKGLAASRGATDFGEYFMYFSFFLVVSALLLATLFFRLGIEQRLREIGLLKALGFAPHQIRTLFLAEGFCLSSLGSLMGILGALAYGRLMMFGLRTWWVGAVGTTHLSLHVSPLALIGGACGGVLSSLACILWTLRTLAPASPRRLLGGSWRTETGDLENMKSAAHRHFSTPRLFGFLLRNSSVVAGLLGGLLLAGAALNLISRVAGFFGAGTLFLVALLALQMSWLSRRFHSLVNNQSGWAISALGFRNATHRPGRSILCIALVAFAAFIIVAVEAFRRDGTETGTGGFPLFAQSLLPLFHDLNTPEGREALGFSHSGDSSLDPLRIFRFRVRQGEDTSCLNLYQPRDPRILAPTPDFLSLGGFAFQDSLAVDDAEKQSPWLLLQKDFADGAIPVIGDANSLTYVLHLKLGQDWLLQREGNSPIRLRVVAALVDSLFQRELLMSELNFKRLFPTVEGYRFFLLDVPAAEVGRARQILEERLADYGFDVLSTADQLASFHRVENTYLSTFQALGGLGLLLGTLGLAIVLLRNVLERRRELALLRAIGYTRQHLSLMILSENLFLLFCGLATGSICALLAIAPAIYLRGGSLPTFSIGGLLLAVLLGGILSSCLATRAVIQSPLLEALRAE